MGWIKAPLTLGVYDLPKSHKIRIEDNLPRKLGLWGLISPSSFFQQTFMSSMLALMSVEGLLESLRKKVQISKQSAVWDAPEMCPGSYGGREVPRLSWGGGTQAGYIEVVTFLAALTIPKELGNSKNKTTMEGHFCVPNSQDSHREQDRTKQDHQWEINLQEKLKINKH